jgi:G2/mitotic-specific cyclin 1/2
MAKTSAATTATTTDNPIGKRKREVLVEVTGLTNNNGKMSSGMVKGKVAKEEGIGEGVSKLRPASKPVRESLRTLTGPVARRSHRTASVSTTSTQGTDEVLRNAASKQTSVAAINRRAHLDQCPPRRVISARPTSASDDVEAGRVFKKRHTQPPIAISGVQDDSQADADKIAAELTDIEEDFEAKPQLWEDLDEGDWDDPTMVSEYVAEVCVYLKKVEVCIVLPRHDIGD